MTHWEQIETEARHHLSTRTPPCATAEEVAEATDRPIAETTYALELLLKRGEVATRVTDGRRRWCLPGGEAGASADDSGAETP